MLISFLICSLICFVLQLQAADAAKSAGCGKVISSALKKGGTGKSNALTYTTQSGQKRTYLLHIPTKYNRDTPAPLIFSFHGRSNTGSMQESLTKFSNEVWNPDSLVVYPDGIKNQWQGDPDAGGYDDVGFVMGLLNKLENEYCIDTSRIYANGMSNGGGFSLNVLACDTNASKKFAAFASNSGAYYQGKTAKGCDAAHVQISCKPGRAHVPILEIHGTKDGVIPYSGGPRRDRCLPSVPHFVKEWARRDGLAATNVTTSLWDGNVKKQEFGTAALKGLVTHYRVKGLSHKWASKSSGSRFNATQTMLKFFKAHPLPAKQLPPIAYTQSVYTAKASSASKHVSSKASKVAKHVSSKVSSVSSKVSSAVHPTASGTTKCPAAHNHIYRNANGHKYFIMCGFDTDVKALQTPTKPGSFEKCIELCDKTKDCGSVSYDGTCSLKPTTMKFVKTGSQDERVAYKLS